MTPAPALAITSILDADVQQAAFGAPGSPGDPERLRHVATRLLSVAEEFLDWAANVRSIVVSSRAQPAMLGLASLATAPVKGVVDFVDDYVNAVSTAVAQTTEGDRGEPIKVGLDVTLDQRGIDALLSEQRVLAATE